MAVRDRIYQPYVGPLTGDRWSFLVIPRYAYEDVFKSRRFLTMFVAAMVWPVISLIMIYLHHNLEALGILQVRPQDLMPIDGPFFLRYMSIQGSLGFAMAFQLGPPLVSQDLAHNALPMYLARPFSRAEYLLGKLAVLAILLSVITWLPGWVLFAFQTSLAGLGWAVANLWLAGAIFLGAWVGILVTALITLALSAWVRWQVLARSLLLGFFVFTAVFSSAINEMFRTDWGSALNPVRMIGLVWIDLFRTSTAGREMPVWGGWLSLGVMSAIALILLERKVRAYEVVG